jgi:hypothetical protein
MEPDISLADAYLRPGSLSKTPVDAIADEDVLPIDLDMASEMAAAFMVDITDETRPTPVGSFRVEGMQGKKNLG